MSRGIVGFDGGYVALGPGHLVELPTLLPPCDESNQEHLLKAASTGNSVLVVGEYDAAGCRGDGRVYRLVP